MSGAFDVAAVIPARNGLPDVLEAVESALAQSNLPREIVVVDDASTDGTGDAVERAFGPGGPRCGRAPVRVLSGHFGSAAAARNAGWRAAQAPWIALLDADDVWFDSKLAAAASALAAAPRARWFFSDGAFRTLEGETRRSWLESYADLPEAYVGQPVRELIEVNFVLTSSVVVHREALETLGGFDASLSHAEDIDLWIRLARRWPAAASRRALVRYQHRAGGLTRQIEARLAGDVELFTRLASDRTLERPLRRLARRRAALSQFKLGVAALREGRRGEARRRFAAGWVFPERALPVCSALAASLLPALWLARVRREDWAMRSASSMKSVRRVVLEDAPRQATPRGRS
ncbi:MAG: glycosyltransferase family 2 protein [Candidatus Eisenbacteria bacterium]|nr:glycosyltransferase family 2 protein [Candidatus Eisenbacteria bacterium]